MCLEERIGFLMRDRCTGQDSCYNCGILSTLYTSPRVMLHSSRLLSALAGLGIWSLMMPGASAIPGESAAIVEAWIAAHPTLRPRPTERLVVNRAETPARRFTFRATVFPITGLTPDFQADGRIRTEQITLVNFVEGVEAERLEESLRVIYGADLYNDYRRAAILHRYPEDAVPALNSAAVRRGELREGDRFAYWLELTAKPDGFTYTGTVSVVLKEDVSALRDRLMQN